MLKEYAGERAAAFAETEVRAYERLLADDDVEIEVDEYGRGPGMLPKKRYRSRDWLGTSRRPRSTVMGLGACGRRRSGTACEG